MVEHMNITIVGGGNIGTQFAVHCAAKGHRVIIYSSRPKQFNQHLIIFDEKDTIKCQGDIYKSTSNAAEAFSEVDIIFVTVPAFCMKAVSNEIYPYIKSGIKIGLIPGTGGGECAFKACLERGAILFGLQRVPSVARLIEYGKSVRAIGYRKQLHVAALPSKEVLEIKENLFDIFEIPCVALPNYLTLTLTPSNPILHTTRLKTLFKDYCSEVTYDFVPLFYEDWDDETSKLLFACDDEVQQICTALNEFDLSYVRSLKIHYESKTPEQFTKKIRSIQGFKGIKTPMLFINGKYIPDLYSRYFVADFSYGLEILVQIANLLELDTSYMRSILDWYNTISLVKERFDYNTFGIINKGDLLNFYRE